MTSDSCQRMIGISHPDQGASMNLRAAMIKTMVLALMAGVISPAGAAPKTPKKPKTPAADSPAAKPGTAAKLRAEWNMSDLKLQHEAVDDGTFPPDIKSAAIDAITWFTNQQE